MRERKESPFGEEVGRHEPYMCCRSGDLLLLRMTSSSNYRIETGKSRDIGKPGQHGWGHSPMMHNNQFRRLQLDDEAEDT